MKRFIFDDEFKFKFKLPSEHFRRIWFNSYFEMILKIEIGVYILVWNQTTAWVSYKNT